MARIKIEDLPLPEELSDEDLDRVAGGIQVVPPANRAEDSSTIKTFVYDDCAFASLDFPSVDAAGGEMLKMTSSWKPPTMGSK